MCTLYFTAGNALFEIRKETQYWTMEEKQAPETFLCLAADPAQTGRLYAGTFDDGLWISDDSGNSWRPAGSGISHSRVMSVAVSPNEFKNGYRVVWAGTEPSGLFRSEDGGQTWTDCPALLDLPSRSSWSFPPRPHTHHVRWIEPDLHNEDGIFVGIELGGVMKSVDKGGHWEDRKPNSQFDCHTLTMNPQAHNRIYEAAGGGYAESFDAGKTWQTMNEGLDPYTYLVDITVDPADPDVMVASASKGPHVAYNPDNASTVIVRREKGQPWEVINEGLPEPDGSSIFTLASHASEPGVFYAVNNHGVYRSADAGKTWRRLPVKWPEDLKNKRIHGFAIL